MTVTPTPKLIYDTMTDAENQHAVIKKMVAAFNTRPETRNAVADALEIEGLGGEDIFNAINAAYTVMGQHTDRLRNLYTHGLVTMPKDGEKPGGFF